MIWIATLCLLAVIAWLFFNALNERRWVQAHSHDESVAADAGILPDFSRLSARMKGKSDGKVSIDQENTRFARAVAKVREKSAGVGERIERQATEARGRRDGDTFFGRAVASVGGAANRLDERLDARMKRKSEGAARPATEENTLFGRATAGVAKKQEEYGARIRARVARKARTDERARPIAEEDSFFGRLVGKVSTRLAGVGNYFDEKAASGRSADDDFLTRTSAKVGTRINEIDEKIVDASKSVAAKIDKHTDL